MATVLLLAGLPSFFELSVILQTLLVVGRIKCTVHGSTQWNLLPPEAFLDNFVAECLQQDAPPQDSFPCSTEGEFWVMSRRKISSKFLQWLSWWLPCHAGSTAVPSPTSSGVHLGVWRSLLWVLYHNSWDSGCFLYLLFLYSLELSLLLTSQSLITPVSYYS